MAGWQNIIKFNSNFDSISKSTLANEYGLAFNGNGELRTYDKGADKITNEPFRFDAHNGDGDKNQERYGVIGKLVTEIIFDHLERELRLQKIEIAKGKKSFFFATKVSLSLIDCSYLVIQYRIFRTTLQKTKFWF